MNKIIGVLAGMGPFSTGPFIDQVMKSYQQEFNAKYDMDYPEMVIYSLPTPFYLDKELDHKAIEAAIIYGLKKLESNHVRFIAMPCNTAHLYYTSLKNAIDTPIINMIDATIGQLQKNKRSTVLATKYIMESELYQQALIKDKVQYVFKPEWQFYVNQIIAFVKQGKGKTEGQKKWDTLVELLKLENIEQVIVACTDLTPVVNEESSLRFIDSSKCLADKVIQEYGKLKQVSH